jgi:hypothetical protein
MFLFPRPEYRDRDRDRNRDRDDCNEADIADDDYAPAYDSEYIKYYDR